MSNKMEIIPTGIIEELNNNFTKVLIELEKGIDEETRSFKVRFTDNLIENDTMSVYESNDFTNIITKSGNTAMHYLVRGNLKSNERNLTTSFSLREVVEVGRWFI